VIDLTLKPTFFVRDSDLLHCHAAPIILRARRDKLISSNGIKDIKLTFNINQTWSGLGSTKATFGFIN